jgi:hypothetical protein
MTDVAYKNKAEPFDPVFDQEPIDLASAVALLNMARQRLRRSRIRCVHCGKSRRRPGGIYCCCLPNEQMIQRNKNPHRCPQCHLAYVD